MISEHTHTPDTNTRAGRHVNTHRRPASSLTITLERGRTEWFYLLKRNVILLCVCGVCVCEPMMDGECWHVQLSRLRDWTWLDSLPLSSRSASLWKTLHVTPVPPCSLISEVADQTSAVYWTISPRASQHIEGLCGGWWTFWFVYQFNGGL